MTNLARRGSYAAAYLALGLTLLTACSSATSGSASPFGAPPAETTSAEENSSGADEGSVSESTPELDSAESADWTTPEGLCSSVPGLENFANEFVDDIELIVATSLGGGSESIICSYASEGEYQRVVFNYVITSGACDEISGFRSTLGYTYSPWVQTEGYVYADSSVEECSEMNGVATLYRAAGLDRSGLMSSEMTESDLRDFLDEAKTGAPIFHELAAAASIVSNA
jgi:hypothetical protein